MGKSQARKKKVKQELKKAAEQSLPSSTATAIMEKTVGEKTVVIRIIEPGVPAGEQISSVVPETELEVKKEEEEVFLAETPSATPSPTISPVDSILIGPKTFQMPPSSSIQRNTLTKQKNGLPLNKVPDDLLFSGDTYGSRGKARWNPLAYTHKHTTGMSSFSLAQDNLELVGTVDFIGDSRCFKKLFALSTHKTSISLLLHRVGKSILVDELDLKQIANHLITRDYKDWDDLSELVRHCIHTKEERSDARFAHRTVESHYHRYPMTEFLTECIGNGGDMEFNEPEPPTREMNESVQYAEAPKIELGGSKTKFLSTNVWEFGSRRFLIGSNVPTFRLEKSDDPEDEPYVDRLTTLGLHSPEIVGEQITAWNGIQMWFNSMSVGAEQIYLCHQENRNPPKPGYLYHTVIKTEFIKTEDVPKRAALDSGAICTTFNKLLDSMVNFVQKPGHSYWIYRSPGTDFVAIYDVTEIIRKRGPETSKGSTTKKSASAPKEPLLAAYGSLLYQMCAKHHADYHPIALRAMLAHVSEIFPAKRYPLISLRMMYLDSRLSSNMDPLHPELKLLNGTTEPGINFIYDYEPAGEVCPGEAGLENLKLKHYQAGMKNVQPKELRSALEELNPLGVVDSARLDTIHQVLSYMMLPQYLNTEPSLVPSMILSLCRLSEAPLPLAVKEDSAELCQMPTIISNSSDTSRMSLLPESESGDTDTEDRILERIREWQSILDKHESPIGEEVIKNGLQNQNVPSPVGGEKGKGAKRSKSRKQGAVKENEPVHAAASGNKDDTPISARNYLKRCECLSLMRDITACYNLITEEMDKYNPGKTSKKVRQVPPKELEVLRIDLFHKISLLYLIMADLAANEGYGRIVMARICAMHSIFFNTEFGKNRPALTCAARIVATGALVAVMKHLGSNLEGKTIPAPIPNPLGFFEKDAEEFFPEFLTFQKLVLGRRLPMQSKEFKNYDLLPLTEPGVRKGILEEGYLKINLDELPPSKREYVKWIMATKLLEVCHHALTNRYKLGLVILAHEFMKDRGDPRIMAREPVLGIWSYLDAAQKLLPDKPPPQLVVNCSWRRTGVLYTQALIIKQSLAEVRNSSVAQERAGACGAILKEIYKIFEGVESFLVEVQVTDEDYRAMLLNLNLRKKFMVQLQLVHLYHKYNPALADSQADEQKDRTKELLEHLEIAYGIIDTQCKGLFHDGDESGLAEYKKAELKELIGMAYERLATMSGWKSSTKENERKSYGEGLKSLIPGLSKLFSNLYPTTAKDSNSDTPAANTSPPWLGMTEFKNLPMNLSSAAAAYNEAFKIYFSISCPSLGLIAFQKFLDCLQQLPGDAEKRTEEEEIMAELMELLENRSRLRIFFEDPNWRANEVKLSEPWPRDLGSYGSDDGQGGYQSYFQNMFTGNISELRKEKDPLIVYDHYLLRITNMVTFARSFYESRGYGKEYEEILDDLKELGSGLKGAKLFHEKSGIIGSSAEGLVRILDKFFAVTTMAYSSPPGGYQNQRPLSAPSAVAPFSTITKIHEAKKERRCGDDGGPLYDEPL